MSENINHSPRASGSNPDVPKDSVQNEIESLAQKQPKWATHRKAPGGKGK